MGSQNTMSRLTEGESRALRYPLTSPRSGVPFSLQVPHLPLIIRRLPFGAGCINYPPKGHVAGRYSLLHLELGTAPYEKELGIYAAIEKFCVFSIDEVYSKACKEISNGCSSGSDNT